MSNKIKLFTDSDLDGLSCGVIATLFYQDDNADIVYSGPNAINDDIKTFLTDGDITPYTHLYITDLTISDETAKLINEVSENTNMVVKLLDHHRTGYFLNKYPWARVSDTFFGDKKTCGAELFWQYIQDLHRSLISSKAIKTIDRYIECVRLWDTWDWVYDKENGPLAKKLNMLTSLYSNSKFVKTIVKKIQAFDGDITLSIEEENLIEVFENKKKRYIQSKVRTARMFQHEKYKFAVVFAEENISDLGNYLCRNFDIDFAVMILSDLRTVSLRTIKEDIDLSAIAKKYGGGGHRKSAGFVYSEYFEKEFIKNILSIDLK